MSNPKVTAIIPCHNHEKWVNIAIDSLRDQTVQPNQIIVVDDGSTDKSSENIIKRLYRPMVPSEQGEPWHCKGTIPHTNIPVYIFKFSKASGPSFARNFGIKFAWESSDIFALLDSDDIYLPTKIEKSLPFFSDQNIGVVYSDFETFNSDGWLVRQFKEPYSRERMFQECICNCDSLISKRAISECGFFDETLRVCEDYDMWLRISDKMILIHIPESLLHIRIGQHSATDTVSKDKWNESMQRVMQKTRQRLGSNHA